nr:hypothetical protein [Tanacetum cinerariifolium]
MTTFAKYMILSGADNHPPMLDKDLYDSWQSRMELYMENREHGRMILDSVRNGPLVWPTIEENGNKHHSSRTSIRCLCTVNHHRIAKDLWERIQMLMQGTSLTKQERECKLYDEFDKFTYIKGELLHKYYLRFTQLINNMNIYKMTLHQFQVNTKFLNSLPPEWSKFVTDVKLVKDLYTTNFDQLHAYLQQHEIHANATKSSNTVNQQTHIAELPQIEYGLNFPQFKHGDDPINALNKMMSFLSTIVSSRFPSTNNQLRTSSNPRQQVSVLDGRVTVQPLQGRTTSYAVGSSGTKSTSSGNRMRTTAQQLRFHWHSKLPQTEYGLNFLQFKHEDDPIDALNKMMSFLSTIVSSRFPSTNNQLRTSSNPRQQASILDGRVTVQPLQGRTTSYAVGSSSDQPCPCYIQ